MLIKQGDSVPFDNVDAPFDVAIIGAGAAGITLALKLGEMGIKTALVEGGEYVPTGESQQLYEGSMEGLSYPLGSSRLRYFGGTTNHWNGWCRPLEPRTFAARPALDYPGWPLEPDALAPYLNEALTLLDIDPAAAWRPAPGDNPQTLVNGLAAQGLEEVYWQWSAPTRFKDYQARLERSGNVTLAVNWSLVDVDLTPEGAISAAVLRHTTDDEQQRVYARVFVLACGGIENARLLLHINQQHSAELGNASGWLGAGFMEHLYSEVGGAVITDTDYEHFSIREDYRFFELTTPTLHERGVLGSVCRLVLPYNNQSEADSLIAGLSNVSTLPGIAGWRAANFNVGCEQAPNPDNGVTLTDDTDRLGVPKVRLTWNLSAVDRRTIRESARLFADYMIASNLGRLRLEPWVFDTSREPRVNGGMHHMGTTRMSARAANGVVDVNSRLHGTQNLYVAGSSVFPTGGYANPTLSIVQLCLRLADHLETVVQQR